jgi:acetyltransferase-like isoleucine patch superfamily enzyme
VVIGAGSVLTKNPGPYEIWAGNPARKIGMRTETTEQEIEELSVSQADDRFKLSHSKQ